MSEPDHHAAIALRGIGKQYGGVFAIRGVDLEMRSGEVLALLGENGAGKSTLVNILGGVIQPDEGVIEVGGEAVSLTDPRRAISRGVSAVHQELALFPQLTVAENVFADTAPTGRFGIDWAAARDRARQMVAKLGIDIDPDVPVGQLSLADQQVIEIAKAMITRSTVLVLDEPTASLSAGEVRRLTIVIVELKRTGVAILFISHRLQEVEVLADRITTLRDGRIVETMSAEGVSRDAMIRQMVGRSLDALYPKKDVPPGRVLLEVRSLTRRGYFNDVSFSVRAGEIVGFSGLVGAGRTEVARSIFGIDVPDSGTVLIDGKALPLRNPRSAMRAGLAYVPEVRRQQGLILPWSIIRNVTLAVLGEISRAGILSARRERRTGEEGISHLGVKARAGDQECATLSGGNQQKVVLAKWLTATPRILTWTSRLGVSTSEPRARYTD